MGYSRKEYEEKKRNPIAKSLREFHPKLIRHKKREITVKELQKEMEEFVGKSSRRN